MGESIFRIDLAANCVVGFTFEDEIGQTRYLNQDYDGTSPKTAALVTRLEIIEAQGEQMRAVRSSNVSPIVVPQGDVSYCGCGKNINECRNTGKCKRERSEPVDEVTKRPGCYCE